MPPVFSPLAAGCACGANRYTLTAPPVARFICHCTICQRYTGRAYSDVTVLLKRDIGDLLLESTDFKRWKLPPNIRRGTCSRCHQPSIEFGIADQLAFVPTDNLQHPEQLPSPSLHAFYDSRVADVADDLPKLGGFLASQVGLSRLLMKGLLGRG